MTNPTPRTWKELNLKIILTNKQLESTASALESLASWLRSREGQETIARIKEAIKKPQAKPTTHD
jgi:hypothetical protein